MSPGGRSVGRRSTRSSPHPSDVAFGYVEDVAWGEGEVGGFAFEDRAEVDPDLDDALAGLSSHRGAAMPGEDGGAAGEGDGAADGEAAGGHVRRRVLDVSDDADGA